ncbi:metallophosphoesterase [Poseidonocella sp. HB161398]|uniref:metallophosphoesterase family protein n=1 Tax=Poseidonocella sp. HB161398 TaxID=2320855 RepID=UPI0011095D34|nr:metallophosphoesterase [Poseidonocella sp. HB161398]
MPEHRVAVIADAHLQAMDAWELPGLAGRSWAETRASTRVFNESGPALAWALADIEARGIRDLVLLGDYTDDGQMPNLAALRAMLAPYRVRGLRVFALPGNHDMAALHPQPLEKGFAAPDGRIVTVTGGAAGPGAVHHPGMQRAAMAEALTAMADCGYFPSPDLCRWETPFGRAPGLESRRYLSRAGRWLIDASYLAEPVPGLWLLMIDANLFDPADPGTADAEGGWSRLAEEKPHLLPWISDVARRAREGGHWLLCCSHYPALDPIGDHGDAEGRLFGDPPMRRRRPAPGAAAALAAAGIACHASGHLHVCGIHQAGGLSNIAVPSLVACPAGYAVISGRGEAHRADFVPVPALPRDPAIAAAYRAEAADAPLAETYPDFLAAHVGALLDHRYLQREWPATARQEAGTLPIGAVLARALPPGAWTPPAGLGLRELLTDWYILRAAGPLGANVLGRGRLEAYAGLAGSGAAAPADPFWTPFLARLGEMAAAAGAAGAAAPLAACG